MQAVGVIKNRRDFYYSGNMDEMQRIVNQLAKEGAIAEGLDMQMGLIHEMNKIQDVKVLMEGFFFIVVIFLVFLSAMVIYSLMLSDVEERTYEFAMLRVLGMGSKHLVGLLSIQTLFYVVPGIILGLLFMFLLFNATQIVLFYLTKSYLQA